VFDPDEFLFDDRAEAIGDTDSHAGDVRVHLDLLVSGPPGSKGGPSVALLPPR
jgi:hypothetical protein